MKRNVLSLGLVILALLLSTAISLAQVGVVATVERDLTLRVGAGTQWRQLTIMPVGTNVALDGRTGDSSWVRGIDQNGNVGWMFANYLSVGRGQIDQLPVIAREAPLMVSAPAAGSAPQQAAPQQQAVPQQQQAAAPSGGGTQAAATANVNVRSGPGTNFRVVGGVFSGQSINLDGRDNSVGWVRGINGEGVVGWVSASYINLNFDQVAALPVVGVDTPFGLGTPNQQSETAAPASAPAAAPINSTAPIRGFAYGGHVRGLSGNTVNAMRTAGMTWVKFQIQYAQGADPNAIAGVINDAHAKGFRVLLGVVGNKGQLQNGGYFDAYANYVGGLAALGADSIEIWNEPNLDREWVTGRIDPAWYTELLAKSYNAIKARNPNTLVISAALAPTGAEAAFPGAVMNDDRYLRGMVNAGALNYADCVGAHYNEGIVPPTQNSNDPRGDSYYTRFYNGMVNTYWSIIGGRKPICFTELGYVTPEGFPPLPGGFAWAQNVTVAQQAAWLDQVMNMARNSGRVRLVIVWNVDFTNYGADPMAGYAIIRPGGGCPACQALGN